MNRLDVDDGILIVVCAWRLTYETGLPRSETVTYHIDYTSSGIPPQVLYPREQLDSQEVKPKKGRERKRGKHKGGKYTHNGLGRAVRFMSERVTHHAVTGKFVRRISSATMKHGVAFRKFSRTSSHRMMMLRCVYYIMQARTSTKLSSEIWLPRCLSMSKSGQHYPKHETLPG